MMNCCLTAYAKQLIISDKAAVVFYFTYHLLVNFDIHCLHFRCKLILGKSVFYSVKTQILMYYIFIFAENYFFHVITLLYYDVFYLTLA